MKSFLCCVLVAVSLLSNQATAGMMWPAEPAEDWSWLASLSLGAAWANAGETQTFYLAPAIRKTYSATKKSTVLFAGELFVGMEKSLSSQWRGELGLALATTGNAKLQGEIWDDANVRFNNYSYNYTVANTRLGLKGKLLYDNDNSLCLMPWVSASAGVGFNRSNDFTNTPLIFEAVPNENFSNNTSTDFSYTLGVGLDKSISQHCRVGVAYEFSDWGKSSLGRASGQTLGSGLALNHLYTNGVMFNLTYLA